MPDSLIRGKADTWVQLQRLNKDVLEFDPSPAQWLNVHNPVRVRIKATRGQEIVDGRQIAANSTHLVRMPWLPEVTTEMRLVVIDNQELDRYLHISSLEDWRDRGGYLIAHCIERVQEEIEREEVDWVWQDDDLHHWRGDEQAVLWD